MLNWANKDDAIRSRNFDNLDLVLMRVHVRDLFSKVHSAFRLDVDSEDGGENRIGNRLGFAKEHFLSGAPMDLPEIGVNESQGTIDFDNGRHRTLAAYQLGAEYVPMFVYKPDVEKVMSMVRWLPFSYEQLEKEKKELLSSGRQMTATLDDFHNDQSLVSKNNDTFIKQRPSL